ncbi:MAG: glycosyltransferase family 39 protein [Candidatus Woesebacteria bacterium]|jgi:4-amino-4-deoxy-L-arabinose transferase-like glycosyltransferase
MFKILQKKKMTCLLIVSFFIIFYLLSHLYRLTALPVFADESIYIRWAQLIMEDWQRYLVFAMNDGKTPLFIWFLVPFQFLFNDQLFAGRFVSVLVGLIQVFVLAKIVKALKGKLVAQYTAIILGCILPFWYFHHRMALMDSLLTLFLSLTFFYLIKVNQQKNFNKYLLKFKILSQTQLAKLYNSQAILAGLFFGLSLLTKLPAVLFIPTFYLTPFLNQKKNFKAYLISMSQNSMAIFLGLAIFLLLKLHPAFGQLFNRGNDFLYPLSEIITGAWQDSLKNLPKYLSFFFSYLSIPVVVLPIWAAVKSKEKIKHFFLLLIALSFFLPILILGKVVYARYFMPAIISITCSATLAFEELYQRFRKEKLEISKKILKLTLILLVGLTVLQSFKFIYYSIFNINKIPFVKEDKTQYLYEWSAGFGVKKAVTYIQEQAKNKKVLVATEGYFGTLPDAILMYLHRRDVSNLRIEGIGQPVRELREDFLKQTPNYDQVILVVNSHRLDLRIEEKFKIREDCRPDNSSCQEIWDITEFSKTQLKLLE